MNIGVDRCGSSSSVVDCLLFIVASRVSLIVGCCLLFVVCRSLLAVCCLLLRVVMCSLFCLFGVCCVLSFRRLLVWSLFADCV